ncbi:Retrovirus-related Pol polyprotein from transposon 17.6 [Gossypium australe]|uniref:Retrovirus-related Pol polyprotein from transposon 17.6 n=1 Tax=Gossypium australe TaxID=47621 RepID=A0A5B6V9F0_9ROSI|nr:Retrovirus-related Pol polyprotein from transposon 17.6 [Gossypium australe]
MPFRLCNAPTNFMRCMNAIFADMLEEGLDIFMDEFLVYGNSFQECLGHQISEKVMEVDKAKIEMIKHLPHPTNTIGV